MFRAILLTAILACGPVAHAQELWQGLSAGMTEEDVRRAKPAAKPVTVPTIRVVNGSQSKLQLADQEFLGKKFEATVFFVGEKLSDVQLLHVAPLGMAPGRALYAEMVAALREKYGQERRVENSRSVAETVWAPDGMIVAAIGAFEGNSTIIKITFTARPVP